MTILQSLAAFYDRLDRRGEREGVALVPSAGLKPVEIDFVLELADDGTPLELRSRIPPDGRRGSRVMVPGTAFNPKPKKGETAWEDLSFSGRTSGRRSYVLWDKSSYVLGVAAKNASNRSAAGSLEPDINAKSREDHAAFIAAHRVLLASTDVPDLRALLLFLERWKPEDWIGSGFPTTALDKNIAFQLRGSRNRLDQLPQARELARNVVATRTDERQCLVSGELRPYVSKHPQFKGVIGAQSSGAAIVSYNWDAFESFGFDKAETAPVSEQEAFKYGAALNWLLDRSNSRTFWLGETTVVYWADDRGVGPEAAAAVEDQFWNEVADDSAPPGDDDEDAGEAVGDDIDADEAHAMSNQAQNVRHLRRAPNPADLRPETRLHVLGLSPNAGRIAVRFWLVDSWGEFAKNIAQFRNDILIEPTDRNPDQKAYALLYETAPPNKNRAKMLKNIPPRLGGELARAILMGTPYPRTLFAAIIGRIRADKKVNGARTGIIKAIINRNTGEEVIPVALDPANTNAAYRLGRLFALIEGAQKAALPGIRATVKDRFFGAACATPARIFPLLHKNAVNHIASVRKDRGGGLAHWMEKEIGAVWAGLSDDLPRALRLEEQGRFIAGYYHQRFTKAAGTPPEVQEVMASDAEGTEQ